MNNSLETLQKAGLTLTQARTYLTLYQLSEAQTGILCKKAKIPSSNIYNILQELQDIGLVGFKVKNNTRVYYANSPESIKTLMHRKKEELDVIQTEIIETISNLKQMPKEDDASYNFRYFEGIHGIKSMWLQADALTKYNARIDIYAGVTETYKALTQFYLEEHHTMRQQKNVTERMIVSTKADEEVRKRKEYGNIIFRTLDKNNQSEFAVCDQFVLLQHTGTSQATPRGFLIVDEVFAQTFKEIFEKLWNQAQPTRE